VGGAKGGSSCAVQHGVDGYLQPAPPARPVLLTGISAKANGARAASVFDALAGEEGAEGGNDEVLKPQNQKKLKPQNQKGPARLLRKQWVHSGRNVEYKTGILDQYKIHDS